MAATVLFFASISSSGALDENSILPVFVKYLLL
jgi:hypothetical protein